MVNVCLIYEKLSNGFSKWLYFIIFPPTLGIVSLFSFSFLSREAVVSHWGVSLHFLEGANDVKHFFHILLGIYMFSFVKCLSWSFGNFLLLLLGWVTSGYLVIMDSLINWITIFVRHGILRIFICILRIAFLLLLMKDLKQQNFNFNKVQFINVWITVCVIYVLSKKSLPTER